MRGGRISEIHRGIGFTPQLSMYIFRQRHSSIQRQLHAVVQFVTIGCYKRHHTASGHDLRTGALYREENCWHCKGYKISVVLEVHE